jgi:hypothetical protein
VLYRSSGRELVAPPKWSKAFPLRAWWACYMVLPTALTILTTLGTVLVATTSLVRFLTYSFLMGTFPVALHAASAVLAILVIRAIQARQEERLRRLEGSQDAATQSPAR